MMNCMHCAVYRILKCSLVRISRQTPGLCKQPGLARLSAVAVESGDTVGQTQPAPQGCRPNGAPTQPSHSRARLMAVGRLRKYLQLVQWLRRGFYGKRGGHEFYVVLYCTQRGQNATQHKWQACASAAAESTWSKYELEDTVSP